MSTDSQPLLEVERGGTRYSLLGTAHVSRTSADAVRELLDTGNYDAVAVELCPSRHQALVDPDAIARMDLLKVIREGKAAMVAANLTMGAYQQRLADQFGIEPGAEQRAAIEEGAKHKLPVLLVDREIGVTLKRTAANVSWWRRWVLVTGLVASLLSKEEVSEDEIEKLKEGDMLETTFAEFAQDRQDLYQPLIAERDEYMAARLQQEVAASGFKSVLAVLGAGHLKGTAEHLRQGSDDAAARITELESLPPKKSWPRFIPWLIVGLILFGFFLGFQRSPDLGWQLVIDWVLINGTLSALGALIAAGHPLTVLTAFLAAPLTSLNPTIGAGMVAAAAELMFRRPQVGDFQALRKDTTSVKGWWKNRVSRTLLVFLFSTLGSAAGTYIAGFRIFDALT